MLRWRGRYRRLRGEDQLADGDGLVSSVSDRLTTQPTRRRIRAWAFLSTSSLRSARLVWPGRLSRLSFSGQHCWTNLAIAAPSSVSLALMRYCAAVVQALRR